MKKNRVYYIRSTSIINDSRASKEITTLINNGYDVVVVGWDRDNRIKDYGNVVINNNKVQTIFYKYRCGYGSSIKNILGIFLFQLWLKKVLKKNVNNIDIIHACDFDTGYISEKIARKYNKKLVYDMYDYYVDSRPMPKMIENRIKKMEDNIINNANVSIICGEWRKEQIKSSSPKKLLVIHNCPYLIEKKKTSYIKNPSNRVKVCYVGILQDNRLIKETLESISKVDNLELHIGGFGQLEPLVREYAEKNENIYFYGSMKYDEVLMLESDCDYLFATYDPKIRNHKYSCPNKVYEAIDLGKPIIVCKKTGIDTFVEENQIGLSCEYDGDELIKTINKIESNKNLKSKIKRAEEKCSKKYNWSVMENYLIKEYKKLEGE